jgi:hypothetical protein
MTFVDMNFELLSLEEALPTDLTSLCFDPTVISPPVFQHIRVDKELALTVFALMSGRFEMNPVHMYLKPSVMTVRFTTVFALEVTLI